MNDRNNVRLSVLTVCLGNICRSPTAEGVLRERLHRADLEQMISVDSAGTGEWHLGNSPDRRATAAAAKRGYDIASLRARRVTRDDLDRFDYVIAMDQNNLADLRAMAQDDSARLKKLHLFGDFSKRYHGQSVGDPYYGEGGGFEQVLDMIEDCADGLIATLQARLKASDR